MSVVNFVCCQVEVSATRRSLRRPADCGASFRSRNLVNEEALARWGLLGKKQTNYDGIEIKLLYPSAGPRHDQYTKRSVLGSCISVR